MRIGIYARVSTRDQSCELQVRDLRAYCSARGFDLVREYVDVGQSGAKDSRPELNKLMDDARKPLGLCFGGLGQIRLFLGHLLAILQGSLLGLAIAGKLLR